MQWTTGDASGGINGFGGSPATIGASTDDSIHGWQIGNFDTIGSTYSGAYPIWDDFSGIDWLDNKSFYFNTCDENNKPFLKPDLYCDSFVVCIGDTVQINLEYFSPETGQSTALLINSFGMNGLTITQNDSGNIAKAVLTVIGQQNNSGYNVIIVSATDNGSPVQTYTRGYYIYVKDVDETFTYVPPVVHIGDTVIFNANSWENTLNVWNFGDGSPEVTGDSVSHVFTSDAIYNVTMNAINDGCQSNDSSTQQITVLSMGINESSLDLEVRLSPNPTNGNLIFNVNDKSKIYSINIRAPLITHFLFPLYLVFNFNKWNCIYLCRFIRQPVNILILFVNIVSIFKF